MTVQSDSSFRGGWCRRRRSLWGSGLWSAGGGRTCSGSGSAQLRAGCGSLRTDLYALLLS
jgi:hypothetical protein